MATLKLIYPPVLTVFAITLMILGIFNHRPGSFLWWCYFVWAIVFALYLPIEIQHTYTRWKSSEKPAQEVET